MAVFRRPHAAGRPPVSSAPGARRDGPPPGQVGRPKLELSLPARTSSIARERRRGGRTRPDFEILPTWKFSPVAGRSPVYDGQEPGGRADGRAAAGRRILGQSETRLGRSVGRSSDRANELQPGGRVTRETGGRQRRTDFEISRPVEISPPPGCERTDGRAGWPVPTECASQPRVVVQVLVVVRLSVSSFVRLQSASVSRTRCLSDSWLPLASERTISCR